MGEVLTSERGQTPVSERDGTNGAPQAPSVPITVEPEALELARAIGAEHELALLLEKAKELVREVTGLRVRVGMGFGGRDESIVIEAHQALDTEDYVSDRSSFDWIRWKRSQCSFEVAEAFALLTVPGGGDGR